ALKPSPGCGTTPKLITSASERTALTITSNNKRREFFVRLPPNYNNTHPYRFVFTLHALGGNAGQVVAGTSGYVPYYGLSSLINDTTGAIFVAPNGVSNGWGNTGGEDVTFLRSVISTVEADLCVDQDLRFSTGFSYGAAMSYSLACSLGKELRAIACLSGNPAISGCAAGNTDAVAYYGQHGVSDTVLPISGGRQMRDRWVKNNGCAAATAQEPAAGSQRRIKTVYSGCKEDKPVVFVAFDGPHTPTPKLTGDAETFSPGETWDFFKQF
ncbi:Alpha/Beta hydrolase protein, partial [Immersiella caudata]